MKKQKITASNYSQKILRIIAVIATVTCLMLLVACRETPEEKFARFMKSGDSLMAKKDPARAALQYQNAAKMKPNDTHALLQLARALLALQDLRQGVAALRKIIDLDPHNVEAQIELSRLKVASNNRDLLNEARTDLKGILDSDSNNTDALQVIALSELKLGSPQEASKYLSQALANAPQNLVIAATLAQARLYENDIAGAEDVLKKAIAASPNSSDAALVMARFYVTIKRYPDALTEYNRALSLDPKNANAMIGLAVLQNATGKAADAEQTLRKLSSLSGRANRTYLADFLYEKGRKDDGVKEFESIFKDYPDDRAARTNLVAVYNASNRTADAQKLLEAALAKNPKDSDALVQRAELLIATGKPDLAEADLNQVIKLHPDSPELHYTVARLQKSRNADQRYREELGKVLELNKFFEPARVDLAQALLAGQQPKAALDVLNQAPESQKTDVSMLVQRNWADLALNDSAAARKGIDQGLAIVKSVDFLDQDALWKLKAGQAAPARASAEAALSLNPGDTRALSLLRSSYDRKDAAIVLEKVRKYAALQPANPDLQEFLGMLCMEQKDLTGARRAFTAAKSANANYSTADLSLAQIDILEGKRDDARNRLLAMVSSGKNTPQVQHWLGVLEDKKGDFKAAIDHLQHAVEGDPSDSAALNNLAYLLAEHTNRSDEALKYAQRAVELAPTDMEYVDTLGWIMYRKGLYGLAMPYLTKSGNAKGNVVWKYHLAMAYAKTGKAGLARTTLDSALRINPNLPEAKAARDLLSGPGGSAGLTPQHPELEATSQKIASKR